MGYDVHITRADDWSEAEASPISLEEWLEYCRTDSEMRVEGYAEVTTPARETIRYENPGLAVWAAYGGTDARNGSPWFGLASWQSCRQVPGPGDPEEDVPNIDRTQGPGPRGRWGVLWRQWRAASPGCQVRSDGETLVEESSRP